MLRDTNLIPLSRQHQHALALCVRIERASPIPDADLGAWQTEIAQHFHKEVSIHFAAEERIVFPVARRFKELVPLVEELIADHMELRASFALAGAGKMSATGLTAFSGSLSGHIRKEERQLFEQMQKLMHCDELAVLGAELAGALADAELACQVPAEITKVRPGK